MNNIIKELNLANNTFSLKSKTTGKYSVQDSYKDNLNNGFLLTINAPQDVNIALKDMYYATEKGLVISYKDFNSKIANNRKNLLSKNFENKDIKELSKDERIKLETESAKIVLKELFINEQTKLIYSPELTNLKENELKNYTMFFSINELKIIFTEIEKTQEEIEKEENDKKDRLISIYLDFSEYIKAEFSKVEALFSLDETEIAIINLNKKFDNLDEYAKENEDIKNVYESNKLLLIERVELIKGKQKEFEEEMDSIVDKLINNKNFSEIKPTITRMEDFFPFNVLSKDAKSISIKDYAIQRLTNAGKVIALMGIEEWNEVNFKTSERLLEETLPKFLEDLLNKKIQQQIIKRDLNKENLESVDLGNSKEIYDKLMDLKDKKDLFKSFFEMVVKDSYEIINKTIDEIQDKFSFIIIIANTIKYEKFAIFWENLSYETLSEITGDKFDYELFSKNKVKNLFIQTLIARGTRERIESVFENIKYITFRTLDLETLKKSLLKLRNFSFPLEDLINKLSAKTILELLEISELKQDNYIRNTLTRTLVLWFKTLDIESDLFKTILKNYTEAIYKLSTKKAQKLPMELISDVIDILEQKNKEDLEQFLLRVGKKKIEEVIEYRLKKSLLENPNNFDFHYDLGINYLNSKQFQNAIFEFKKCIGINAENHLGYYNLGIAYEKNKQFDLALSQYKKSASIKFGFNDGYFALGSLYLTLKEPFLAIQQFKKIQKTDPNNYDCCVSLGIAYEEINEPDNAIIEYEKAIKIDDTRSDAYINIGVCLVNKGLVDEAIETFKMTIENDPQNSKVQFNLGILYQQKGENAIALASYKLATKFDPNNSQAYNNLGLIYFYKSNLEESAKMWEKSIELDNNIDAYNNLGWAYYVIGQYEKAIEVYVKAKKVNPKHAVLSMNLGTVYFRINDTENAIKQFEDFVELDPNSESGIEVSKILKGLKNS
ncbi:MAG: tetratricopeptide repeat protein [Cyanobacteriota bacterium]